MIKQNKAIIYAFIFALQIYSYGYSAVPEKPTTLASEIAKAAASENMKAITGAGACISLIANVYEVGKDVKSYVSPSKQQQARAHEVAASLKLMELKQSLRRCLLKNSTSKETGLLGMPQPCEETVVLLGLLGASDEVNRMATIFRAFKK